MPERFVDRTLEGFEPAHPTQVAALDAARRMVAGGTANLILVGQPGRGKTHLAAGVVNAIVLRERAVYEAAVATDPEWWPTVPIRPLWLNVADAIASMRLEMDAPRDDREVTLLVRRARNHAALVVLDDLGREKASDWTGELVYALVNNRYEKRLPTIVTSNLTPADLAASPYWPIVSRLAEDGELVKVAGDDHRLPPTVH